MKIEYEATFAKGIDKEDMREKLKGVGADLVRPEFLQKRVVFDFPGEKDREIRETGGYGFLRVRDEGDKTTLTLKIFDGKKISDQKETEVVVSDFDETVAICHGIGCVARTSEESKRELWKFDETEVTIDTWPFLGSIVEVEGKSEEAVKAASEKLGFDWSEAKFCSIGLLYREKFGLGPVDLAKKTGQMTNLSFSGQNPFIT